MSQADRSINPPPQLPPNSTSPPPPPPPTHTQPNDTTNHHQSGSLRESIGRAVEAPPLGAADPLGRMVALHLYEGALKIVPFTAAGRVQEPFSVRLEEANVLDLCFLHGHNAGKPTIAVLYADQRGARHVKTYAIGARDREAAPGPWQQLNVERGANMLIPVPDPVGGVVIVGSQTLTYHRCVWGGEGGSWGGVDDSLENAHAHTRHKTRTPPTNQPTPYKTKTNTPRTHTTQPHYSGRSFFKAIPVHAHCICAFGAVDADGCVRAFLLT